MVNFHIFVIFWFAYAFLLFVFIVYKVLKDVAISNANPRAVELFWIGFLTHCHMIISLLSELAFNSLKYARLKIGL